MSFLLQTFEGKISSPTWENLLDTISKFQQAHRTHGNFICFKFTFFQGPSKKRTLSRSLPTMASKVDSRLIKSVVFRPWLQWRGLIEWRYVILGQQKLPWPLVLIHPRPSHTYISMPYLQLASIFSLIYRDTHCEFGEAYIKHTVEKSQTSALTISLNPPWHFKQVHLYALLMLQSLVSIFCPLFLTSM